MQADLSKRASPICHRRSSPFASPAACVRCESNAVRVPETLGSQVVTSSSWTRCWCIPARQDPAIPVWSRPVPEGSYFRARSQRRPRHSIDMSDREAGVARIAENIGISRQLAGDRRLAEVFQRNLTVNAGLPEDILFGVLDVVTVPTSTRRAGVKRIRQIVGPKSTRKSIRPIEARRGALGVRPPLKAACRAVDV